MTDLAGQLSHLALQAIEEDATGGNGSSVDLQQFQDSIEIILDANNTAGSSPTLDVHIEDSPDDSTWTDVTGAAFTQVTDAAASKQTMRLHTRELDRYIRAVVTIGGTSSPAFLISINAVGVKRDRT